MKEIYCGFVLFFVLFLNTTVQAQSNSFRNPIIWADVPDISMIRICDTYFMSSITMHMSPGVPIMKSKDLVNWKLVNYACDILDDVDALNLTNGKSTYGKGSWKTFSCYQDTGRICRLWLVQNSSRRYSEELETNK
jgi:beta-xylosidase